jgi:hypothetical protein
VIEDVRFRILRLRQERESFAKQIDSVGFTDAQVEALRTFLRAFDELSRIVVKEEGAIVGRL